MADEVPTHPVQLNSRNVAAEPRAPQVVTLRAYEVYCHVYSPQEALITGWCRGGFGVGELVAFLYAHSFPKEEWRMRVDEAFKGLQLTR
jgi:hypothetical protein